MVTRSRLRPLYTLSRQRTPLLLLSTPVEYLVNRHFAALSSGVDESYAYINPDRISCGMPL